jgi:hypothetical protein
VIAKRPRPRAETIVLFAGRPGPVIRERSTRGARVRLVTAGKTAH